MFSISCGGLSKGTTIKVMSKGPYNPQVVGDSTCVKNTNEALALLKNLAPSYYNIVAQYTSKINCKSEWSAPSVFVSSGATTEALIKTNPPEMNVYKSLWSLWGKPYGNINYVYHNGNIYWAGGTHYAAALVHEAIHLKQYADYMWANPYTPEILIPTNME